LPPATARWSNTKARVSLERGLPLCQGRGGRLDGRLRVPRERDGSFWAARSQNASLKGRWLQVGDSHLWRPVTQERLGLALTGGMMAPPGKPEGSKRGFASSRPARELPWGSDTCLGLMTNARPRGRGHREVGVVG